MLGAMMLRDGEAISSYSRQVTNLQQLKQKSKDIMLLNYTTSGHEGGVGPRGSPPRLAKSFMSFGKYSFMIKFNKQ